MDLAQGRGAPRARLRLGILFIVAAVFVAALASPSLAQNPPPVQTFYVPVPEDQAFDALTSVYPGNATCGGSPPEVQNPISTTISIAVIDDGAFVYYDQWEDGGYDADIANPTNVYSSPGNLSGTQIWGDGDTSNGAAPGFPGDVLSAGNVIVLENDVTTTSLGDIDFDGRDKVAGSSALAVTRAAWAAGSSTLLAGAVEVFDTALWGTEFEAPVGEDTPSSNDMFEHTSFVIMAAADGTSVDIDADANGIVETTVVLAAGESHHVNGGVNEGGTVSATSMVQVHLLTGDVCSTYESRWFTLVPVADWSDEAFTPVATHSGDPTYVFVHNPGPGSITVEWETLAGPQTSLVIADGATAQAEMTLGSGARFFTNDGSPFFAVSTIDSDAASNTAHDWGFSMIPEANLTQQALVGWGPGQDPTLPVTENSSPVWVTPVNGGGIDIEICVDFDGDNAGALTDAFGNNYDLLLTLDALEIGQAFDPDGDQTGTILYVCDGSSAKVAVAWGQDPDTASGGAPAIDVGTTVPPLPAISAGKGVSVEVDLDGNNLPGLGETLRYTIVVQNISRVPVSGATVADVLPSFVTYVASSTTQDDGTTVTPVPDAGATAFPLDEGGIVLPVIAPGDDIEVSFLVTVTGSADACGAAQLVNEATVTGADLTIEPSVTSGIYCDAQVDIEKATNGVDADTPTGPLVLIGDPVTWTYVVTNPGTVPVAGVVVTDDQGVTVTPVDLNTDTFNDGDLDLDGLLDVGETWLYTASGTATAGQYTNIGTATGTPSDEGGSPITDGDGSPLADVSDDDPSNHLGVACVAAGDCDNGVFCDGAELCVANVCQPGSPIDCDDGVACTVDACNEATDSCDNTANDALCDDSLFCNGTETCDALGGCQPGTPVDCDDGVVCTVDTCNEATDSCDNVATDALCDDAQFCNGTETCDALGGCQPGTSVDCDDGVACTVDACNDATDSCDNTPTDALCDDSQFCTGVETCDALGGCQAGTPVDCDDGVGCTADSCNEATDSCDNVPDDAPCSDSVFCNGAEVCDPLNDCQAGTAVDCDDAVACTTDACNEVTDSCDNTPTDSLCDDSAFCNGVETCDPLGGCQPGTPIDCDDAVACTADACNESTDSCDNTATDALCDDSEFCNGTETCDPLNDCQAGTAPDCDDTVPCTVDSCDEVNDECVNTADDASCNDFVFCNGQELCDPLAGCGPGTPVDCTTLPSPECATGACDEVTNTCLLTPINEGGPCDDGDACTPVDVCTVGNCVGGGTLCGNGVLDGVCGEICEPGSGEICNDMVDNDFDGLVDCADPDCCEDLEQQGCGLDCQPAAFCKAILNDPAVIKLNGTDPDFFKFHGRVAVNPAVLNPVVDGFSVQLSNSSGIIYSGTLLPGDMIAKSPARYMWKDKTAKNGVGVRDGLFRVRGVVRKFDGAFFYAIKVKAYGDFSAADEATMTTQVSGVDDVAVLTATWQSKKSGWVLRLKDLLAGAGAFQCNEGP